MRKRMARTSCAAAAVALLAAGVATAQETTGKVRANVTANLEAAEATVDVLPQGGGDPVATGPAGRFLDVPAGTYDLKVTLTEAIDDPSVAKAGVRVEAGAEKSVDVDFEVSRVTLICKRDDAAVSGAIKIRRPGATEWLPGVRCGEQFIVSGGSYEAEVTLGTGRNAAIVTIERLQIMSGATQRIPLVIH